jgi:hypothetical protein
MEEQIIVKRSVVKTNIHKKWFDIVLHSQILLLYIYWAVVEPSPLLLRPLTGLFSSLIVEKSAGGIIGKGN